MKLTIASKNFYSIVAKLQGVVDKKNTIPLLANLLLKTAGGKIVMTGTDLGIGVKVECEADIIEEGTITLSARKLFEILKEIPEGTVTIETGENNWVSLKSQNSLFRMIGMPADNYPVLTEFSDENVYQLDKSLLHEMLHRTEFAVSNEGNRVVFTGIQFSYQPGQLKMTATDGHRLSIIKRDYDVDLKEFEMIIPKKTCREILNLIDDADETVLLGWTESKIMFQFGQTQLVSNLIEGKYPNMEKAIPEVDENVLSFNRQAMLGAVKRASIFSDNVSFGVRFDFEKDHLTVSSNNPELGEAKEELEVSYEGVPQSIGFNSRYLLEVLAILQSEDVLMKFTGPTSSALINDPTDPGFLCLIMPMRI